MADVVSVQGLTGEQVKLVQQYVDLLRGSRPQEEARERLLHYFEELRKHPVVASQEEADELAQEAVAWARRHP